MIQQFNRKATMKLSGGIRNLTGQHGLLMIFAIRTAKALLESSSSPMNGKHIVLSGTVGAGSTRNYRADRNATGYITSIGGISGHMLEWLSIFYNFTHSPLQVEDMSFDGTRTKPGLVSYIIKGECDIVASIAPTKSRVELVDFSHPCVYNPVGFLIPAPDSSLNVLAMVHPFSTWTWLILVGSLFAVFFVLYFLERINSISSGKLPFLAIGLLFRHPGYCSNKQQSIRLLVVTWGLAVFMVHNYYTGDLTSFITAPNPQPLIKSIYDLQGRPELYVVTENATNTDAILSSAESGIAKVLGDRLRSYPKSRCTNTQQCVDMVKKGNAIYTAGRDSILMNALRNDFLATGKCNMKLGDETFMELQLAWTTQKKSPYMNSINIGIMRMREFGLLSKWIEDLTPDIHQCKGSSKITDEGLEPLPLKGLSGSFFILCIGFLTSMVLLFCEKTSKIAHFF